MKQIDNNKLIVFIAFLGLLTAIVFGAIYGLELPPELVSTFALIGSGIAGLITNIDKGDNK
jgi:Co/Zn/Cd efflux system component